MLVDVVRMRLEGVRLPKEQVKTCTPVRGQLSVMSRHARTRRQERVMLALLLDPVTQITDLLPPLDDVRLTALRGNEFVLLGTEELTRGVRRVDAFTQSWWCRLVGPTPGRHSHGPSEEAAYARAGENVEWLALR